MANGPLPCSFPNTVHVPPVGVHMRGPWDRKHLNVIVEDFSGLTSLTRDQLCRQSMPSLSQCPDLHGVCPLAGLGLP